MFSLFCRLFSADFIPISDLVFYIGDASQLFARCCLTDNHPNFNTDVHNFLFKFLLISGPCNPFFPFFFFLWVLHLFSEVWHVATTKFFFFFFLGSCSEHFQVKSSEHSQKGAGLVIDPLTLDRTGPVIRRPGNQQNGGEPCSGCVCWSWALSDRIITETVVPIRRSTLNAAEQVSAVLLSPRALQACCRLRSHPSVVPTRALNVSPFPRLTVWRGKLREKGRGTISEGFTCSIYCCVVLSLLPFGHIECTQHCSKRKYLDC